jgi:amidophosphoribosyltransferase
MVAATDVPGEKFCTACFSSEYPIPVPEHVAVTKHMLEQPPVVGGPAGRG